MSMTGVVTQPPTETQRYFSTLQAGIRTREVVTSNYRGDRLPMLCSTVARIDRSDPRPPLRGQWRHCRFWNPAHRLPVNPSPDRRRGTCSTAGDTTPLRNETSTAVAFCTRLSSDPTWTTTA